MYQQIPGQNVYNRIPGIQNQNVNIIQPTIQYQNNLMENPIQMGNNTQNIQSLQNIPQQGGAKRKTYTPGQYQAGKLVFQAPELMPRQPMHRQPQSNLNKNINLNTEMHLTNQYIQNPPLPQYNIQQTNPIQPQMENTQAQNKNPNYKKYKKTATLMTVKTLSSLPYSEYTQAEYSHRPFYNICGYAFNSYNGKVRNYNEDRTKTIVNYPKKIIVKGKTISPRISYFGIFDGHGGQGCSEFLTNYLDYFLFNSKYFPASPIQAIKEAFRNAEKAFMERAIDKTQNSLVDQSGSCALVMLIINDILYAINLGDSRALYSTDSGQNLLQITRDHKPNDDIEKARIEKSGAKVYYGNRINVNGKEVELRESDYGEGFTFPYRISPGNISVSL